MAQAVNKHIFHHHIPTLTLDTGWMRGFFPNLKSNLKRQNQRVLEKVTIACVHINDTFSLQTSVHGLLNSYNIQTNIIRSQMLFIVFARYINTNCTINNQTSPTKKKSIYIIGRGIRREASCDKQLQKTKNKCYEAKQSTEIRKIPVVSIKEGLL